MGVFIFLWYIFTVGVFALPPFVHVPNSPVDLSKLFNGAESDKDRRIAFHVHGTARVETKESGPQMVRFLYLVPKVGANLSGGLATPGMLQNHVLPLTVPQFEGEELLEFLGFSDCKTWHAEMVSFWAPNYTAPSSRAVAYLKDPKTGDWNKRYLPTLNDKDLYELSFFEFVKDKVHWELRPKLLELLPTHPETYALAGHLATEVPLSTVLPKQPSPPFVPSVPVEKDLPREYSKPVVLDTESKFGALDNRVAFSTPVSVIMQKDPDDVHVVRFLHLVPKLGSDLSGGFATPGRVRPVFLSFTVPDTTEGETVELIAFSDCKTWYALHLTFWLPKGEGFLTNRAAGFVRDPKTGDWVRHNLVSGFLPPHDENLVRFVKDRVHWELLPKLVNKLPSHPVTHALASLML
ncbi:putative integral membrane protein [Theileria parva strain Muguga]|uniref:putative integral membrane protein n=1 Tax=Theileria parva strain Muguga TaxID=333668 RepID=UPI001C61DD33|nr:putative integral membrane protein [Theileria parva strain Muguga]EAN34458.2 putative integral membrane protein [Theileria parva strain Muguga]